MTAWRIASWSKEKGRGTVESPHFQSLPFDASCADVDDFVLGEPVEVELEALHDRVRVLRIWPARPDSPPESLPPADQARWTAVLGAVNELLAAHTLAAVRLIGWELVERQALFEVFHCEFPLTVYGRFRFREVSYLQCPAQTPWGYRIRVVSKACLPSYRYDDPGEPIFELFAPDGDEPSAFIVAADLEVLSRST